MQVAGKAGCMVENTPRGVSWKMTALLVILVFRARQQNPFRNYLSLRTGWLYFLKIHDVSPAGLGGQSLDESLLESGSQISFSLGHGSWRPPSLSPGISHLGGISLLGTSRAGKQVKKGCSSPGSCLEERQGLEPDFTLPFRTFKSPHNGIFWSCRISN